MQDESGQEVLKEAVLNLVHAIVITHLHSDHFNYSTLWVCRKQHLLWVTRKSSDREHIFQKRALKNYLWDVILIKIKNRFFSAAAFEISHGADNVTSGFNIVRRSEREISGLCIGSGHFPDTDPLFQGFPCNRIESNHDPDLLWKNPNRPYLHKRG